MQKEQKIKMIFIDNSYDDEDDDDDDDNEDDGVE